MTYEFRVMSRGKLTKDTLKTGEIKLYERLNYILFQVHFNRVPLAVIERSELDLHRCGLQLGLNDRVLPSRSGLLLQTFASMSFHFQSKILLKTAFIDLLLVLASLFPSHFFAFRWLFSRVRKKFLVCSHRQRKN